MTIARIENGQVAETRDLALTDVPAHKRGPWRIVVGEQPAHDARMETCSGFVWEITADAATRVWTVTRKPTEELKSIVKVEAQRRIIALTGASNLNACLVKQMNALMRGTELTNKLTSGGVLTAAEDAEADALQAMADKIKAVRAASNTIEALDPIPADFDAAMRWPA